MVGGGQFSGGRDNFLGTIILGGDRPGAIIRGAIFLGAIVL